MKIYTYMFLITMLLSACGNNLESVLVAIKAGDTEIARKAIETSPGIVKVKTNTGNTILFESLRYGHDELSKISIQLGADLNITNSQGVTPIYFANTIEMAKHLIASGADKNIKTFEGTPLHWAAKRGNVELVQYYIEEGIQLDHKSGRGNTALDLAIKRDNDKVVAVLKSALQRN